MPRKLSTVLTPLAVRNAKPGRHPAGRKAALTGERHWRVIMGLSLHAQGQVAILAKARDARDALRLKVQVGIDPLEERQREATAILAAK